MEYLQIIEDYESYRILKQMVFHLTLPCTSNIEVKQWRRKYVAENKHLVIKFWK